jgi:hypothetical protein
MNYDITEVDRLSSTSATQRAANIRWLARHGEQTQIEAIKLMTDLIRQYRRANQGQLMTPEFGHAMHALALVKMTWMETAEKRKGGKLSEAEYEKIHAVRVDRIKAKKHRKGSPKREMIRVRFYHDIKDLRQKGLSWREVADYLSTHHKTKLAYSYLRDTFNALTAEREKAGT